MPTKRCHGGHEAANRSKVSRRVNLHVDAKNDSDPECHREVEPVFAIPSAEPERIAIHPLSDNHETTDVGSSGGIDRKD